MLSSEEAEYMNKDKKIRKHSLCSKLIGTLDIQDRAAAHSYAGFSPHKDARPMASGAESWPYSACTAMLPAQRKECISLYILYELAVALSM